MAKRVRPVIIVVENSTEKWVQEEIEKDIEHITDWVNRKIYMGSRNRGLVADIFQFPSNKADRPPNVVVNNELRYTKEEIHNTEDNKVCLDPLLDYLCKLDFLNNRFKYVQPIVIFAMEGSREYVFDKRKFRNFKRSYIYSNALRAVVYGGKPIGYRREPTKDTIEVLKSLANKNQDVSWDEFCFQDPHMALIQAFMWMEDVDSGPTDVVNNYFPEDCVIRNGKIRWVKTKSLKRIWGWLKDVIRDW